MNYFTYQLIANYNSKPVYKISKTAELKFKYAQTAKLLDRLNQLGVSESIKNFVINLDSKFQGIALGVLAKNLLKEMREKGELPDEN